MASSLCVDTFHNRQRQIPVRQEQDLLWETPVFLWQTLKKYCAHGAGLWTVGMTVHHQWTLEDWLEVKNATQSIAHTGEKCTLHSSDESSSLFLLSWG